MAKASRRASSSKPPISSMSISDRHEPLESVLVPPQQITAENPAAEDVTPPLNAPSPFMGDDNRRQFSGVVVSRRKRRLEIVIANGSIADVPASAYVLGLFEGVTPSGAADAIDHRSNGLIRDFYNRHVIDGALGKVSLVPTNCTTLMPDLVAFIGLGGFGDFTPDRQFVGAAAVIKTLVKLRVTNFATVLIGETMCDEDVRNTGASESLRQLLMGFMKGLRDCDSEHLLYRIVFAVPSPDKYESLKEDFYGLAATKMFDDTDLVFAEMPVTPLVKDERRPEQRTAITGLPDEDGSPSYLHVSDCSYDPSKARLRFSFLTASGRGSLPTAIVDIDRKELDVFLTQFDPDHGLRSQKILESLGDQLAGKLFPRQFIEQLAQLEDVKQRKPLRLVHDAASSKIPWEALRISGDFPALSRIVSRHFLGDDAPRKLSDDRLRDATLDVLMVVDPSNNLPGAREEAKTIMHLFGRVQKLNLVVRTGDEATRKQLINDFRSGNFDIVHYAGHAGFDPVNPKRRGLLCSDGDFLTGDDLSDMTSLPTLVFLNACQSARMRKLELNPKDPVFNVTKREQMKQTVSVAEAFLRGGLKLFLGTYWPVGDAAAMNFSSVFYDNILNQKPIGQAVHRARQEVLSKGDVDWADYMLYGDARFALKQSP